jgi:spectinomycin phosphotransferase
MLEKPDLPDQLIVSRLQEEYGLQVARVTFLPLGADINTVVYRVETADEAAYFLKLRKGPFTEITVTLPAFLKSQGIQSIIAPLPTTAGQLWASLDSYKMVLYPFIEGCNGYEAAPSNRQWQEFGAALRALHTVRLPPALSAQIPHETYSPYWQNLVKDFQVQVEVTTYTDPTAVKMAAFMQANREMIDCLVDRAGQLGQALRARNPEQVLCHSDIHAGNLHLATKDALYIVDWDAPIFSPKELDLAMLGGSTTWNDARQEALFYQGYGQAEIDSQALAYYRCERVILDIAAYGEQLLLSDAGSEDREQSYQYFTSNFLPDHEIDLALNTMTMSHL